MRKVTVLVALIILSQVSFSYALNIGTHKAINEYIANNSLNGFSLDTYLRNNLGIQGGVTEKFKISTVWEWLRDGGEYEDEPPWNIPYIRSLNHFHNPITEEGFKGDCYGLSLCVSSTVWALMPLGTQSILTGNYSWLDVRDYYYKALTSTDKTTRDSYFAQTFRGLGQLMHLIQDASVPAHTRNDFHLFYNYEDYAGSFVKGGGVPTPLSSSFFSGAINNIASFIDTNQYNGTNSAVTLLNSVGLSEYSNANFFSEDTIFSANYPNPAKENTNAILKEQIAEDGQTDKVYYIQLNGQDYRLAAYSYFKNADINNLITTEGWKYNLDDHVYSDYASLLLPRAVGYSAGLLNYFFRGKLAFVREGFDRFRFKNLSSEPIEAGNYTLAYDDGNYNRRILASFNLSTRLNQYELTDSIYFSPPTDNITSGRYMAIFKGKLGQEDNAVIGSLSNERIAFGWASNIFLMTPDENNILHLREGLSPVISPDGNNVAFVVGNGELWLFDMEAKTSRRLTTGYGPSWSSDGNKIAFQRDGDIFSINLTTDELRQLTYGGGKNSSAWSPDGAKIAFSTGFNIGFVDPNGNSLGTLFDENTHKATLSDGTKISTFLIGRIVWSPDGAQLAFMMCRYGCIIAPNMTEPTIYNTYIYNFSTGFLTELGGIEKDKYKPLDFIHVDPFAWSSYYNDLYAYYYIYINETDTVIENNIWALSTTSGGFLRNITRGGAFLSNTTQY